MKLLGQITMLATGVMSVSVMAMAAEVATTTTTTSTQAGSVSAETHSDVKVDRRSAAFYTYVQSRYSLTDAQIVDLKEAKLNSNQTLRVAELAKMSGKSVEDVIKMRYEQKMGWGRIAKELNLRESKVSHAVNEARKERRELFSKADMREDRLEERAESQIEKRQDHADKMKARVEGRKQSGLEKAQDVRKEKR